MGTSCPGKIPNRLRLLSESFPARVVFHPSKDPGQKDCPGYIGKSHIDVGQGLWGQLGQSISALPKKVGMAGNLMKLHSIVVVHQPQYNHHHFHQSMCPDMTEIW